MSSASAYKPSVLARWLEKAPIPWIDQFFVLANVALILLAMLVVRFYGIDRSLPFAGQTVQVLDPAVVLPIFVIYEAVTSYYIWWKKPLATGQAGWFLVISLVGAALFYALTGGVGSIYFYPFVMVILYAVLSLKTGAAVLFIFATVAVHLLLGRTLIPATSLDVNMARIAADESMALLVLGGVSLFFTARLRRDAQAHQTAQAQAGRVALLHDFSQRLAEKGPELSRMLEIIAEVAHLFPHTELGLVLLHDPAAPEGGAQHDPPLRVAASTSARHPVGEPVADLEVSAAPRGRPHAVRGLGAGYATPLPAVFAEDGVRQVILVPLHLATEDVRGVFICGRQSDQPLSADEEAFALDLAITAGLAVRYARLFAREQEQVARLHHFQELQMNYFMAVAHDMKTPLTVLTTLAPTLRQLPDLPAATRQEIVEAIEGNLARLEWSINGKLMAARLDSGIAEMHARPLDLASSIRQVVAHISSWLALKRQGVEIQAAPDLPLVRADGSQLEYVITNLLVNASKFAPAESAIVVTLQPTRLEPTEPVMQVCVEDEGPGVPPAQRERIFEKFHTQTPGQANSGAGLGLYICRAVVRRHGGRIWVEDRPGGGSRFCFTLPLVADEGADPPSADPERAHAES